MTQHIAIVGCMHSGKSTLAAMLVRRGYTRIALADAVKDSAAAMVNGFIGNMLGRGQITTSFIDRDAINRNKRVYRPFLQWLGTDLARNHLYDDEVWIRIFGRSVAVTAGPVVCDDVRFPNEAAALREMGFRVVRLRRDESERRASIGDTAKAGLSHASETEVEAIVADEDIWNRSLADLTETANRLAGKVESC